MIPLLIRWTLGCNYQSWGPRKTRGAAGDDGFLSFPLYLALYLPPLSLSLSLSPSRPFLRFVSQRRRGIDSY